MSFRLPSDLKKVFHPIICCALSADIAALAFAYLSNSGIDPVLGTNSSCKKIVEWFKQNHTIAFMLERFSKFILFEARVGCSQNGLKKAVTCLMKVSTLESERKSKGLIYCQQITKFATMYAPGTASRCML